MGQHLGHGKNSCMLRTHLGNHKRKVEPEKCVFRLLAYGPILKESKRRSEHEHRRDNIAALEKALAEALSASGYKVMNTVHSGKNLNGRLWQRILGQFAKQLPKLKKQKHRAFRGES